MNPSTIRTLLIVCLILDVLLLGAVLYDYFQNDSDWIVGVLGVFALFVLLTAVLFALAGRKPAEGGERVVVQVVEKERIVEREVPGEPVPAPVPTGVLPPIPPAPLRKAAFVAPVPPAKPRALAEAAGPFRYNGYTLHTRQVELANGGGKRAIYFFAKRKPRSGKPCPKPAGYHVGVNERTGLPFLKKGAGPDGEDLTPQAAEPGYRPQCAALTEEGKQCRNSAREGSKYCAPHYGYQPPVLAKATVERTDTKARVPDAPDTKPAARRSWFGRRKAAA